MEKKKQWKLWQWGFSMFILFKRKGRKVLFYYTETHIDFKDIQFDNIYNMDFHYEDRVLLISTHLD
jgi:hypothetical protein